MDCLRPRPVSLAIRIYQGFIVWNAVNSGYLQHSIEMTQRVKNIHSRRIAYMVGVVMFDVEDRYAWNVFLCAGWQVENWMSTVFLSALLTTLVHIDLSSRTVAAPIFLSTKTFEKRYENGSLTPFYETPLSFFETSRRLANEIIAGIAV